MGFVLCLLALPLALWLIACLALVIFQRALQYRPSLDPLPDPAAAGLAGARGVVLFPLDGLSLTAWYLPPPPSAEPPRAVALFHGNAGSLIERVHKARMLAGEGLGVLMVEWRGYGGNPGRPTEAGLLADGRAAIAFLEAQGIDRARQIFYGESLGSGVAFHLAAEGPAPAAVITEGAFTRAVDVGARRYRWMPVRLLMRDRFDSLAAAQRVTCPVLILHGRQDGVVPFDMGPTLASAVAGKVSTFFPDQGGHVDLLDHGAQPVIAGFLREGAGGAFRLP
ncbi:alpha/beta hydrolase [Rhodospirillum rubrum]|uniref:Serine aminopeptidase S33 domain-containing protein n=1 Tax=Rhodospirillum rubrum (strain ATCC 11170 / ATH 1.1.1 / DSM 467 / LMG 4362 / NCIMB 8255 / S1) TaxID=269796 RepID=Q2RSQ6_RHORT|nr:alpha/beta hydrolase [Rhodospirillum rubrum]ABC22839.1 conserved hypothetical protein Rv2307c [Rhodospirillum rubrum ATCC 11170]AEO48563.1 hypothetical protein F11_10485 [Rhodospirillum rubrum F11]MBK5954447.1 alpha/beta hydrolase [Rhodospirillum rubrum]QXG78828.1 alpha/beta hydrolase [Rhodospirillum rubrum]HAP99896.1 alpha/beta hydrolase [Rhodospirillum rubrum]